MSHPAKGLETGWTIYLPVIRHIMRNRARQAARVALTPQSGDAALMLAVLTQEGAGATTSLLARLLDEPALAAISCAVEEIIEWTFQSRRMCRDVLSAESWRPHRGKAATIDEAIEERLTLLRQEVGWAREASHG